MKNKILLLLTIALISMNCTDRDDEISSVNIRIKNTSTVNYDSVNIGGAQMPYENIAPDAFSEYMEFEIAYRYDSISIVSGTETYTLQIIDFVGETPLTIGFYTYELSITETGGVEINFVVD